MLWGVGSKVRCGGVLMVYFQVSKNCKNKTEYVFSKIIKNEQN